MGMRGRSLEMRRAVRPETVGAMMQAASSVSAVWTAAMPTASDARAWVRLRSGAQPSNRCGSVSAAIRAMVRTASTGCLPEAVSPDSITQSVPS